MHRQRAFDADIIELCVRWCFTFAGNRIHKSSTAWDKAKERAGIEEFRFHDLRHTWAS
jgi:integrase